MKFQPFKKVVLVILDGFGVASYSHGNAIALAQPQSMDRLISHYPAITLLASGPVVGLPWGEVGNSEVGHLNIGAGRIVGQDMPRINAAIQDRSFFRNQAFLDACEHVKRNKSKLHIMGMVSAGGVHSSEEHLSALLGLAMEQGLDTVYIHVITDGRDTGEKDAFDIIKKLQGKIRDIGIGTIATVMGRFYAMDRGKHWQQTELAYQAMTEGVGNAADSVEDAILNSYNQNIYDEMIMPTAIIERQPGEAGMHPVAKIEDNDAVIFFNHRSDRALQLTQAFVEPDKMDLPKKHAPLQNLFFVTMTEYYFGLPVHVAFHQLIWEITYRNYCLTTISNNFILRKVKSTRTSPHFLMAASQPFPGEERKIVSSPDNNRNYAAHPEMSGPELTEILVDKIKTGDFSFYLANYANSDMVGHTGNLEAGVKAVHYLDRFVQEISDAVLEVGGALIITADHGNIESMINRQTGEIDKEHSTSPVPFMLIAKEFELAEPKSRDYLSLSAHTPAGIVSDIAPTILELMNLQVPPEMNGRSLLSVI